MIKSAILTAAIGATGVSLLSGGAAQALTANGLDYDYNLTFTGVDDGVFTEAQTFALGGPATGWTATISGKFSDATYFAQNERFIEVSSTNQTGAPYENPGFRDAEGLYFRDLPDNFDGQNLTVSFDITFNNVSSQLDRLDMAVYAAESVDNEIDRLTNANPFTIAGFENITSAEGSGTFEVVFRDFNGVDGRNGQWTTTTSVTDGNTITWTYDYTLPEFGEGKNMLGFNVGTPAQDPSVVPVPAALPLLLSAFGGMAFVARRRRG